MKFSNYLQSGHYNKVFFLFNLKFIGKLIKKGKKQYAWKLYFLLKFLLKRKIKKDINIIILVALLNSLRKVHFIKKRFGSVRKEIPVALKFERQVKFALNEWLSKSLRLQNSLNMKRLIAIICASYKFKGIIIKQNYDLYKKAIENRILLRFIKR